MNINETFKIIRNKADISQGEMAKRLGITQPYLSTIENGSKTPSTDLVEKMGKISGVPVPVIMFLSMEKSDVPDRKKELYKDLKPILEQMAELIWEKLPEYKSKGY